MKGPGSAAFAPTMPELTPAADGATPSGGSASHDEAIAKQEHLANVMRMRWVVTVGAILWFFVGALDWSVVRFVEPGPLSYFWTLRGAELVVLVVAVARLSRKPPPSPAVLRVLDLGVYTGACLVCALMCIHYRGVESPYAHGISCILIARGMALPDHYKRNAIGLGLPALIFPVTLLAAAPFSPIIAEQLARASSVTVFIHNIALVFVTYAILLAGGHAFWSIRRQVFEARDIGRYRLKRRIVGSSRVDLQACKLEYSIVSPK